MVERCEEAQAVVPLEQRLFDLHLAAGHGAAGGKTLGEGQELCSGFHLVSDHLKTLLPRVWSCTHTVGL